MTKKNLWIGAGTLAVAAIVIFSFSGKSKDRGQHYRSVIVSRSPLDVTIPTTGIVQPQNRLEIKPTIAGRAEGILVKEGQMLKKGQTIAWMSSTERAALLDAARAKGKKELNHWMTLYKATPLIAPISGRLISKTVEPGQTVTTSDTMFIMSDRLIVRAQVDETDIGKIQVGQGVSVTLDAYPQNTLSAKVDHIAYDAKTVNNVTIYEVQILPKEIPEFMRSGMTATVVFQIAKKEDAVTVPSEAVRVEEGHKYVLIPEPSGKKRPVAQEVQTGLSDGRITEIVSGLKEGDSVLIPELRLDGAKKDKKNPFGPSGGRPKK